MEVLVLLERDKKIDIVEILKKITETEFVLFCEGIKTITGWNYISNLPKNIYWFYVNAELSIGIDKEISRETKDIVLKILFPLHENTEKENDPKVKRIKQFIKENSEKLLQTSIEEMNSTSFFYLYRNGFANIYEIVTSLEPDDSELGYKFKSKINGFGNAKLKSVLETLKNKGLLP